jgi:hypothetical protein
MKYNNKDKLTELRMLFGKYVMPLSGESNYFDNKGDFIYVSICSNPKSHGLGDRYWFSLNSKKLHKYGKCQYFFVCSSFSHIYSIPYSFLSQVLIKTKPNNQYDLSIFDLGNMSELQATGLESRINIDEYRLGTTESAKSPNFSELGVANETDDFVNDAKLEPEGDRNPGTLVSKVNRRSREVSVKEWVLSQAAGICECCGEYRPFKVQGNLFLEVHHVQPLAEGGPDIVENTVAVCPNCHRSLHLGDERGYKIDNLYLEVPRLQR